MQVFSCWLRLQGLTRLKGMETISREYKTLRDTKQEVDWKKSDITRQKTETSHPPEHGGQNYRDVGGRLPLYGDVNYSG